AMLMNREVPASECVVLFSGRASFELIQKAVVAGFPVMAAVGAPSSLAVSLAQQSGSTLIGFLKRDGFNVYSGHQRITA
ncbi:MAG: formate dehydrogenase accessory sulfurtransferase FdhD, partial [Bacteroidota bacterium]